MHARPVGQALAPLDPARGLLRGDARCLRRKGSRHLFPQTPFPPWTRHAESSLRLSVIIGGGAGTRPLESDNLTDRRNVVQSDLPGLSSGRSQRSALNKDSHLTLRSSAEYRLLVDGPQPTRLISWEMSSKLGAQNAGTLGDIRSFEPTRVATTGKTIPSCSRGFGAETYGTGSAFGAVIRVGGSSKQ